MNYYYVKNGETHSFTSLKKAVSEYTNKSIFNGVRKNLPTEKDEPINLTDIMDREIKKIDDAPKFSYKGKMYNTAKDCYEEIGLPKSKWYGRKYVKAKPNSEGIIELDDSIDNTVRRTNNTSFDEYVRQIKNWYKNNNYDPSFKSENEQERKLAYKIQNLRKAYKDYLLISQGLMPKSTARINEKQIEKLNKIGFIWTKR